MALGVYQFTATNQRGDVVPGAMVEVKLESDGTLAVLKADAAGATSLSNPFPADADGFARFYVSPGVYKIKATTAGAYREWRNVSLGGGGAFGEWSMNIIGVGTATPESKIHVVDRGVTTQPRGVTIDDYVNAINAGSILLRHARGTPESPAAVQSGDSIGAVAMNGYDGTGFNNEHAAIIQAWASQNWTASHHGTYATLQLVPTDSTTLTELLRFTGDGKNGFGTPSPLYQIDVRNTGNVSQIHMSGTGNDDGGYMIGFGTNGLSQSGGAAFNGSAWIAKDASAAIILAASGNIAFYSDTGLTPGSSFTPTQRLYLLNTTGYFGVGAFSAVVPPLNTLDVKGSVGFGGPITKTANFTLALAENYVINNKTGSACVATLPSATGCTGRRVVMKTIQAQAINSVSSNVVPLAGGAAGTAIVTGTAGKWAELISDGTNWIIMAGN